ncbi:MAG: FAD-dependent oxidoreductase [Clostridiales bacterium]|nr:FAD-dependent oxidoreductase [Clostridiales bacterium]
MESIWSKTCTIDSRPSLEGYLEADAVIIGAGMTGILTAYRLQCAGIKVILLESGRIASGQTCNTTAKITSQHGLLYHRLVESLGKEKAALYGKANEFALQEYRRIIDLKKISCDFEETDGYVYSDDAVLLKKEVQAAASLGLPASFTEHVSLPLPAAGAVRFQHQAQFHPLKFIKALAASLTIYEHSQVKEVKDLTVYTENGAVTAKAVIFACHYPIRNVPGFYFARMHQERSYVLALENAMKTDGMFIGEGEFTYSFRNYHDLLLFGGAGHRTGENPEGGCYESLRKKARELFPNSRETACWSAQDCITGDHLPFIGPYALTHPHWYVASGFQKWGMTASMTASLILCDALTGKENAVAPILKPFRFSLREGKAVAHETGHAAKGLTRRVFRVPDKSIDELPCGHGGIVLSNGEKLGVYKDEHHLLHVVDIRCPHMGCQLEWNPDEKSWDCPCHGSRFDYDGNLLSNPAQKGLRTLFGIQ